MLRPRQGLFACLLLALVAPLCVAQSASTITITYTPEAPQAGTEVQFGATTTANVTLWAWEFGDGTLSNEAAPRHTFSSAGQYIVRLTITTQDGETLETSLPLTVMAAADVQPAWTYPTWLYWAMPLLVGFILLAIASMVLVRGQPVIYNRVFFLLYVASALKSFSEFIFYLTYLEFGQDHRFILPVLAINRAIGFLYPHLFVWFVLVFPRPLRPWLKNGRRGSIVLLLAAPFFLMEWGLGLDSTFIRNAFNAYVSLLALVALGLLVYHAWETDGKEERHRIRLLAATFFLLVMSTISVTLLQFLAATADPPAAAQYEALALAAGLIFVPLVEIIGCILLMYAILRYQLLGVELFLRRVTRATSFAISVGSVFVIVSNSVEQVFESKFLNDIKFGFIVAGFISTALMYPIQKATERLANRMFPHAESKAPDVLSTRRMEIYEAQLRYALLDGHLKEKELTMLHALRDSLQLRPEELKHVAQRFPGANVASLLVAPPLRSL